MKPVFGKKPFGSPISQARRVIWEIPGDENALVEVAVKLSALLANSDISEPFFT